MIRVDAIWLALGVSDLRGGIDVLLGQVVRGFAGGAQPHSAYVFANRRLKFQLRLGHHRRPDNWCPPLGALLTRSCRGPYRLMVGLHEGPHHGISRTSRGYSAP